ncbi:FAD-dependent monooxygenase [Actinocatenispora rupis]|uniref:FAD-dependent oxidoreductase n=1 Tax=Actinocatenispora rupis TaxID=519421 RepID=A0A8J3NFD4_9ACTN|nr:FAD-dependent monooxygenase [Actinocatenispora rupis]GID13649.1 FAD-dependent oxidoreductase [Actinocatenispora rupis]
MSHRTVLISGAGIAGLTLAYWLRRHGWAPTVVERAPDLRAGGYKIDIRGAALDVVARMGLLDEIRARTTDVRGGHVVDATGRRVASMDGDTFGGRVHGDAEIHRGDLADLLRAATDVEYRFGDAIAALDETDTGVTVTYDSGDVRTYDLVVGADGLHSRTRRLAFGPEERYVRPMGYRIAVYSVPNHLDLDREELTYVGAGRTALTYSTARDDGAKAMFLYATPDASRRTPEELRRELAEEYRGEGWEVPTLLAGLAATPDFYADAMAQVHMDAWSRGRVALVGDAAYAASPASGQGTSLALVGAYVLAGELAAAPDHRTGFAAYERAMRPYVAANQRLGPANVKRMVLRSKGQVRLSMAMLSVLGRLPGHDRMMARVVAPIHRAATAIALRTY